MNMNTRVHLFLATVLALMAIQGAAAARIRGFPSPPPQALIPPAASQANPSAAAAAATAAAPSVLPSLDPIVLPSGVEVDRNTVVLRFKNGATAASTGVSEKVHRRPGAKALGLDMGVVQKRDDESVEEAVVRLNALSPDVDVEPNYIWRPLAIPNDAMYAAQQAASMGKIAAPAAWDVHTGSAAATGAGLVCIIDTGIDYKHPDLAPNFVAGYNAIDPTLTAMDDMGHGTHCAGTIGAAGNNGAGVAGLNWAARLLSCKFMGPSGGATVDAIECVNWCVAQGAKVLSNSWGGGGFSQALLDAINAANAAGALFVAAAGNSNINVDAAPVYPASYAAPNVISVAASTPTDTRATYSNYGTATVHIAAPGNDIASTYPNGTYVLMSGTSMAAPFVSGAAALMHSATGGKLTGAQVRTLLLNSADRAVSIPVQGNRRLNVAKAVNAAIAAAASRPATNTFPAPAPATRAPPPPTTATPAPTPTNSNPSAFPPPPPLNLGFPVTPIARGQTLAGLNLSTGGTFALPAAFLSAATCATVRPKLTGAGAATFRKHVYELGTGGSTAALTASTCGSPSPSAWDSVTSVLTCNAALTACSACAVVDNTAGCGLMGTVSLRSAAAASRYLVVVTSVAAGAGGAYTLAAK